MIPMSGKEKDEFFFQEVKLILYSKELRPVIKKFIQNIFEEIWPDFNMLNYKMQNGNQIFEHFYNQNTKHNKKIENNKLKMVHFSHIIYFYIDIKKEISIKDWPLIKDLLYKTFQYPDEKIMINLTYVLDGSEGFEDSEELEVFEILMRKIRITSQPEMEGNSYSLH